MSGDERYEVIVVGAGPAGSTAARRLAVAGRSVLLLERDALPRYKACGGGVGPKAVALLPFPISELPCVRLTGIDFRLRGGSPVAWELPAGFPFYMAMRSDLDARLARAAAAEGAVLRDGESVRRVTRAGGGHEVETGGGVYRARFLVAADGGSGVCRRYLGLERQGRQGLGLECELVVSDETRARFATTAVFDVEACPGGYGWIFPKATHLSVGLGTLSATRLPYRTLLQRFVLSHGLVPERQLAGLTVHTHPLPIARTGERARSGNALLVGDAAGVADGFGGEGISYAMTSGALAADAICAALREEREALESYEADLDRLIRGDHRFADWMGLVVRRFPDAGYRALTSLGEGRSALLPVLLGELTFAEAVRRLPRLVALSRASEVEGRPLDARGE